MAIALAEITQLARFSEEGRDRHRQELLSLDKRELQAGSARRLRLLSRNPVVYSIGSAQRRLLPGLDQGAEART